MSKATLELLKHEYPSSTIEGAERIMRAAGSSLDHYGREGQERILLAVQAGMVEALICGRNEERKRNGN